MGLLIRLVPHLLTYGACSRQPRRAAQAEAVEVQTQFAEDVQEQASDGFDIIGQGFCRSDSCLAAPCPHPWKGKGACISLEQCFQECRENSKCLALTFTKKPTDIDKNGYPNLCNKLGKTRCVQYFEVPTTAGEVATKTIGTGSSGTYTCYAKQKGKGGGFDFDQWMGQLGGIPQGGYACGYSNGWCGCSCGHNRGNTTPCYLPPMKPGTQGGHTCGYHGNLYGCAEAHNTLEGCPRTRPSGPAVHSYVGCYSDDSRSRELPVDVKMQPSKVTMESCSAACSGYTYFGLQNHGQCFCGNGPDIGDRRPESECTSQCHANPRQICGGWSRNSVYRQR